MSKPLPIYFRVHTVPVKNKKQKPETKSFRRLPRWAKYALVLDCETTTDISQNLLFGFARFCELTANGKYECRDEVLFYPDDLADTDPDGFNQLKIYAASENARASGKRIRLLNRSEFVEQYFWETLLEVEGTVVCYNAPFDLSRLAIDCRSARKKDEGWSFILSEDIDPRTGLKRENIFRPRLKIIPKDSHSAFIKLTGVGIKSKDSGKRLKSYNPGRFVDLKTTIWALRSKSLKLKNSCGLFQVEKKWDYEPTGKISREELDYCRQDVRSTTALLNAVREEFDLHPIDLRPEQAYSPASIAKAYLRAMNITPPMKKFALPHRVHGIAMQSYYGGQAECRIRHVEMPIVHTDVMSEYTSVNVLLGLWDFLTAEKLRVDSVTVEIRTMLNKFASDHILEKDYWRNLSFFALIEPCKDVLPVRSEYNGVNTNIGMNSFEAKKPIWYSGPDLIASILRTGKVPAIQRAIRIVPEGKQKGMRPVSLRGQIMIDPYEQDFFKSVIEQRACIKDDKTLDPEQRKALADFLKILASSGSYGLFVQIDPKPLRKGKREWVSVFSGERQFKTTTETLEIPGKWYFPIFGSLITAGGRLMLAVIENRLAKRGGSYLFCDTDSMAIVGNEHGGFIPCAGGPHQGPDGTPVVKALSWKEVYILQAEIDLLNPYDRSIVRDPILKIEDVNFVEDMQRPIHGFAIAAKRYVLYSNGENGMQIVSAKAHGLGFLHNPKPGFNKELNVPGYVIEGWHWILDRLNGKDPKEPDWFEYPAMMRCVVTTREVLKALQRSQADVPYPRRAGKPFNFCMIPLLDERPVGEDRQRFSLVTPFQANPSLWLGSSYINIHDPNVNTRKAKRYRLAKPDRRLPSEALAKTYGDFIARYPYQREAKSNGPDGHPTNAHTEGLLTRIAVQAANYGYIGKETDRRWEQGEDISLLESEVVEYRPNETARLSTDFGLVHDIQCVSIRALAREAGVTENTVKRARRGERLQKTIIIKLRDAARSVRRASQRE